MDFMSVQEPLGLTGCSGNVMVSANGPSTPGLPSPLALARRGILPSSMHKPWAESNSYKFSELNTVQGGTASPCLSSSLPFCLRFSQRLRRVPYTLAAKLDTEPAANSYSGGIYPRSFPDHFQFARSPLCSPSLWGSTKNSKTALCTIAL